jgi:hypothetical protein
MRQKKRPQCSVSKLQSPIDASIFVREEKHRFRFGKIPKNSTNFELKICQYESVSNLSEFYRRPKDWEKSDKFIKILFSYLVFYGILF